MSIPFIAKRSIFHTFYYFFLSLPEWAEKALKQTNGALEYFAARFFESFTHTTEMKKAKAGFLIKEIFNRFKNKTLNLLHPDRSLWIYSAHDNTIINVLNALNVYQVINMDLDISFMQAFYYLLSSDISITFHRLLQAFISNYINMAMNSTCNFSTELTNLSIFLQLKFQTAA